MRTLLWKRIFYRTANEDVLMAIEIFNWQHKETKEIVKAVPWYEIEEPIIDEKFADLMEGRKFKIGALIQVGWLIKNKHGVWLGVGPKAKDSFDDLGLVKEKKRKKK